MYKNIKFDADRIFLAPSKADIYIYKKLVFHILFFFSGSKIAMDIASAASSSLSNLLFPKFFSKIYIYVGTNLKNEKNISNRSIFFWRGLQGWNFFLNLRFYMKNRNIYFASHIFTGAMLKNSKNLNFRWFLVSSALYLIYMIK